MGAVNSPFEACKTITAYRKARICILPKGAEVEVIHKWKSRSVRISCMAGGEKALIDNKLERRQGSDQMEQATVQRAIPSVDTLLGVRMV